MTNKYTELKHQAEVMLSQMTRGKEFIIGNVSREIDKVANENPQDHVIIAMARVVEKMSQKDSTRIISQAELDNVYQNLIGLNTNSRFRELLGKFLITAGPEAVQPNEEFIKANRDLMEEPIDETDTDAQRALSGVFDNPEESFDPKLIETARKKVSLELYSLGFNSHVKYVNGNPRFTIFAANFQTPNGIVTAHIPAESSGEKFPSVFIAGDKIKTLTKSALESFIKDNEHNNIPLNVLATLSSLDSISGYNKIASRQQLEKAVEALPDGNGKSFAAPEIFASVLGPNEIEDIKLPMIDVPEPLKHIAADFDEQIIEASLDFPLPVVRLAKRMLYAELAAMGFKGAQISITDSTNDGLICEALLNSPNGKVVIEVPIEMKNNQPLMPSVFAQGDFVDDFSQAKIASFMMNNSVIKSSSIKRDSGYATKTLGQLKNDMAQAVTKNDFDTCDKVLETIAMDFSNDQYRDAVKDYQHMLKTAGTVKNAYEGSRCSNIVKSSNSIYPMCGHLMLPLHEVVQDEDGRCHRASTYYARKEQKKEGAFFSSGKILLNS